MQRHPIQGQAHFGKQVNMEKEWVCAKCARPQVNFRDNHP